ncbi:hypothetical protein HAX54_049410, partial [Datura stramonium]|nr:hypothetical protein [Datura stramonium]
SDQLCGRCSVLPSHTYCRGGGLCRYHGLEMPGTVGARRMHHSDNLHFSDIRSQLCTQKMYQVKAQDTIPLPAVVADYKDPYSEWAEDIHLTWIYRTLILYH